MTPRHRTFRIAVRKFPPFEQAIRAEWAAFEDNAHTGLALDLVLLDLHPLEHALFTSGGMCSGDWDVAFVNTDWIAAMHALGAAVDLAPLVAADPPEGYPAAWAPSVLRLQRLDDAILGVPFHDGPECLILRRDLFDDRRNQVRFEKQFHRPLAPPATWKHLHQLARFFQDPATGLFGTVFAAFPDGHNTIYDFLLQLWTRNGSLQASGELDPRGRLSFQTPAAAAALTFYRAIINDPAAVPPDCLTLDSVAAGALFAAGSVAFMVNWFGFAAYAHTSPDSAIRGLVDVAPIPAGPGGSTASLNVYWILAMASGSPHREVAWQFLRHTQSPAMDLLVSSVSAIGCRRSTWQDAGMNAEIPFYHRLEALHQNAREIPQRPDWPRISAVIDTLVTAAVTSQTPIPKLLARADAALAS